MNQRLFSNHLRGKKAKAEGAQFEELLRREAHRQSIHIIEMPLGCRRIGIYKLIQIKTPFDFILILKGVSSYIDCKSFNSERIGYSQLVPHQIEALMKITEAGCKAGYIVWFRSVNSVVLFEAKQLAKLGPNEGYHYSEGTYLGRMEDFALGNLFV